MNAYDHFGIPKHVTLGFLAFLLITYLYVWKVKVSFLGIRVESMPEAILPLARWILPGIITTLIAGFFPITDGVSGLDQRTSSLDSKSEPHIASTSPSPQSRDEPIEVNDLEAPTESSTLAAADAKVVSQPIVPIPSDFLVKIGKSSMSFLEEAHSPKDWATYRDHVDIDVDLGTQFESVTFYNVSRDFFDTEKDLIDYYLYRFDSSDPLISRDIEASIESRLVSATRVQTPEHEASPHLIIWTLSNGDCIALTPGQVGGFSKTHVLPFTERYFSSLLNTGSPPVTAILMKPLFEGSKVCWVTAPGIHTAGFELLQIDDSDIAHLAILPSLSTKIAIRYEVRLDLNTEANDFLREQLEDGVTIDFMSYIGTLDFTECEDGLIIIKDASLVDAYNF
ncbi:hypothetical protein [Adhaeretor mobilis]|uniref:Uncharacterized protein n=1 Tax=Adhaeretor mobilis TaxID=1930276 RepID=A0A517N1T0_9BACT|nr:hypothetical protein [Adhaeretor mobilis]QDT01092.1 hypothetical protein HG15A2_44340 [Adhaeretor mobilis]